MSSLDLNNLSTQELKKTKKDKKSKLKRNLLNLKNKKKLWNLLMKSMQYKIKGKRLSKLKL